MTDSEERRPSVELNSARDQLFSDHAEESEESNNQLLSNQVEKRKSSNTGYNNPNKNNSKIGSTDDQE